jgi:hypothetical protein
MAIFKRTLLLLMSLLLVGCAHVDSIKVSALVPRDQPCATFLSKLEETVAEHGVRDASTTVVPGFPYLRVNRFYQALGERARQSDEREQWVDGMRRLYRGSLQKEIGNLPAEVYSIPSDGHPVAMRKEALLERAESCSDVLYASDRKIPEFHSLVGSMSRVPDEYSSPMRILGIHPLASLPVIAVTDGVRKRIRKAFEKSLDRLPVSGTITAYRPAGWGKRPDEIIQEAFDRASDNPLRIPTFTKEEENELARDFAPVFFVDVTAGYDRPGAIEVRDQRFDVDSGRPTLYFYASYGLKGDRPILQLNYVLWFGERAGKKAPWIERGHLDGLTVRVSLTPEGKPFLMDFMNNCGCYHLFVPDRAAVARVKTRRFKLDPFVPQWLPPLSGSERYGVRVNSGWHQVERVLSVEEISGKAVDYGLAPYEEIESLEGPRGLRMSLFTQRGIAKGTGRIEPLIFFSMGIPSVGSMRQRGHHAIDLVGRAHFDDPHLMNRTFVFK